MKTKWFLSPSALSLMRDCKRCFWLDKVHKIKRPRGIFPSLPGGMDRVIKTWFDSLRREGRKIGGLFEQPILSKLFLYPDQNKLDTWRNWRTGLRFEDAELNVTFVGAVDDALLMHELVYPFDYKTKGKPTTESDAKKYYQTQLDSYAFLFLKNKMNPGPFGVLLYYSPEQVVNVESLNIGNFVKFNLQPIVLDVDPNRAFEKIKAAVELLNGGEPKESGGLYPCEYCAMRFGGQRDPLGGMP